MFLKEADRHRCFISYHHADQLEVKQFVEDFSGVMIPKTIGVSDEDEFIDSDNTDYVIGRIREKYIRDCTVTIVLVGRCTWARRYVDWEVAASLRAGAQSTRNGLMAITLPSVANYSDRQLPPRVDDNVNGNDGYAKWWKYPQSRKALNDLIGDAYARRDSKMPINSRQRMSYSRTCP